MAQALVEKETPEADEEALRIYDKLFELVFVEDNYAFNNDIIDSYYKLQIKLQKFPEAIRTKKRLIKYLIEDKCIDHQIRRHYLEIVILLILFEDVHKIDETLQQFLADAPNAYMQDEYQIASKLWEALKNQNFEEMV